MPTLSTRVSWRRVDADDVAAPGSKSGWLMLLTGGRRDALPATLSADSYSSSHLVLAISFYDIETSYAAAGLPFTRSSHFAICAIHYHFITSSTFLPYHQYAIHILRRLRRRHLMPRAELGGALLCRAEAPPGRHLYATLR